LLFLDQVPLHIDQSFFPNSHFYILQLPIFNWYPIRFDTKKDGTLSVPS
jgi:hypothetical protein